MIEKITKEIHKYGFDDYKIIEIDSCEHQLYLLKEALEAKRTVDSHYYEITVYQNHDEQGKKLKGEYTFVYKPGTYLKNFLELAKFACSMVRNRYYALLDTTSASRVKVLDPRLSDPNKACEQLCDTIYRCSKSAHVRLSSAEIYLKKSVVTLLTSTGIEVSKEKGLIEIEFTLISKKGANEQELNFHIQRRNFDDLHLETRLKEYQGHVRSMLNVQVPESGKATVIFMAPDVYDLFSPIVFHSSGRAKDQAISRFRLNEKIVRGDTNTFTLKSSGLLPYGLYTDPFDDDGIAGGEHTIIEQGTFKKYWTTKRYADYLGTEPTGDFRNLIIEPSISKRLSTDEHYEIVQFSDFSPDPITGDFVAEIRFGYRVRNGKKTPVKGGSVAGNLFESLKHVYFNDESTFEGNYLGPRTVALQDLSISGK